MNQIILLYLTAFDMFYIVELCLLCLIVPAKLFRLVSIDQRLAFTIDGSSHKGRYGQFVDTFNPKPEQSYKKLVSNIDDIISGIPNDVDNGATLRKSRERNLKIAESTLPTEDNSIPRPQRKRSNTEIEIIVKCLNLSYGDVTSREDLTKEQRVGVIDWGLFDDHARQLIESYNESDIVRKRIKSWIKYHREKKEISLVDASWMWVPRTSKR